MRKNIPGSLEMTYFAGEALEWLSEDVDFQTPDGKDLKNTKSKDISITVVFGSQTKGLSMSKTEFSSMKVKSFLDWLQKELNIDSITAPGTIYSDLISDYFDQDRTEFDLTIDKNKKIKLVNLIGKKNNN